MPSPAIDDLDRRLLNRIQSEFPLAERPYAVLAAELETTEADVMERLAVLKGQRFVRQVCAIFDTRALGYQSSLVAVKVAPERADEVAQVINAHPGVSHNYRRNHAYNIWYTIAVPPTSSLEANVERLSELAGATATRLLPTLRLFKIGVKLDLTGEASPDATSEPAYTDEKRRRAEQIPLTDLDRAIVRALQDDLPIVPEPYTPLAAHLGTTPPDLFARARQLMANGHLRRISAILYHRNAGFRANPMAVWAVPEERVQELGTKMASFSAVSHCYHRPVYPDWPYSLFTMIHGRTVDDCREVIAAISATTGITDYALLYSTREYKKTRLRFFTDEHGEWERTYL